MKSYILIICTCLQVKKHIAKIYRKNTICVFASIFFSSADVDVFVGTVSMETFNDENCKSRCLM